MAPAFLKKNSFRFRERSVPFWATPFPKQGAVSENKPLPFETVTADEGPSYSSPSRTVDLRAKVMQQLQQAFGHRRRASACVCVTTTCNYNLSLRLPFFSQSHSVTFPPFLFFFCIIRHASQCACTEYTTPYIFLYLPHM